MHRHKFLPWTKDLKTCVTCGFTVSIGENMLYKTIELEAKKLIFAEAATGSDRFRQWVYKYLPWDYSVNSEVNEEIDRLIKRGYSAQQIKTQLVKEQG